MYFSFTSFSIIISYINVTIEAHFFVLFIDISYLLHDFQINVFIDFHV